MTVKKDKVVEMHYTLKNDVGDVLDSSKGQAPMPFLQGHGNIIPGFDLNARPAD
jgi:FKBP-type peptidyl-prolyl cis-trans isomerase SlyD